MAIILGVLGARNAITKQIIQDEILTPILDDLNNRPIKILLPSDCLSSTYIECWAERQGIPVELIQSDWIRQGKRASVLRDARIEKESTALLVFEGPRSRYYMDLAERIAKRRPDCSVYIVNGNSISPVLLEVDQVSQMSVTEKEEQEILTLPKLWKKTQCLLKDD